MLCQNCGAQLEIENQKFCQNCGNEIKNISGAPQKAIVMAQKNASTDSIPLAQYPRSVKNGVQPDSYSKSSLGFGIITFIIGLITLSIGSIVTMDPLQLFYYLDISYEIAFSGLAITHVIGIIFGIISTICGGKGRKLDPYNVILRWGILLGSIGLILNSILFVVAIILRL